MQKTVVVDEEGNMYEKTKGFLKRHSHKIVFLLAACAFYTMGNKNGVKHGIELGYSKGFGIGAAAACDVLLDTNPEKRAEFMNSVFSAWNVTKK